MQNYSSTVFPALIAIPIYAWLYNLLKKHVANNYHTLVIPFVCIFLMVPFVILIIGPVAVGLGDLISSAILVFSESLLFLLDCYLVRYGKFWLPLAFTGQLCQL